MEQQQIGGGAAGNVGLNFIQSEEFVVCGNRLGKFVFFPLCSEVLTGDENLNLLIIL
jgi:hypothetical protein